MKLRLLLPGENARGQSLPMFVIALVAILAMVGLVVDGGNAWGQLRATQNGADAAAEAGAVVLVERLGGATRTDADVLAAVRASAASNQITLAAAYYTDIAGNMLGPQVGDGSIPTDAAGVRALGSRPFNTYFARIVGINDYTANTEATAVAGKLSGVCPADADCGLLPVTFPVVVSYCDNTSDLVPGSEPWPLVSKANATAANMAIVPLCKNSPGSVGWLDLGPGNLAREILEPTNQAFDIPTWLHTQTGNVNAVETEMNTHAGQIVLLPLFDGTCRVQPSGSALSDCPNGQEGVGNNTWYHIPKFTGFLLYQAYTGGNDPECNETPGNPVAGGNGGTGCLKGWFTRYVTVGPVSAGNIDPTDPAALGVQLIK